MSRPYPIDTPKNAEFWRWLEAWLASHMTAIQVADVLGVDRRTVTNMVKDGRLTPSPVTRRGSRAYLFDPEINPLLRDAMEQGDDDGSAD